MIEFKDVAMEYANGTVALHDFNLKIEDGEFVFVVGRSGAGKTTLTKLLMCEERITRGKLTVNDYELDKISSRKIPYLRRTMGVVFQDFRLFENMNVYENVAFAMQIVGASKKKIDRAVPAFLELVGLTDKMACFPNELSGGEQQRVAFARALINDPQIVIADEPTGNVDKKLGYQIFELLDSINKYGKTVIVVTHDTELVEHFKKRTITIDDGVVVSDVPAQSV